ncbi:NAD(P)-binding protein [Lindgomyces ingoldianus]|uniref:NAD(P)-binding protein n=1 Tax=Lindgomyces ingoldianus TaxID=673940 RepID=A0ACB6QGB8_9PLEO|nr:NAD(P)-binding protein [Lindgomyces ingoldianus]KAF2465186.1 NAD(P)-binding protein [Lindgomyces ingoldianus]
MYTSASRNLSERSILITGASVGIGRSTAFEFARSCPSNLKIILTARRIDKLHQVSEEIQQEVGNCVKIYVKRLDVSKPGEINRLVVELPEEFKNIDMLMNNASDNGFMDGVERPPDVPQKIIEAVWAVNVTGVITMTQAILPNFKARPSGGRGDIIMLGSIAGRDPYVGGTLYCSSKAAVRAFTDALRKELISTRIRIITVDPGHVLTEFTNIRYRGDQEKAEAVYAGYDPLSPDDVAEVIAFAASRRENVVVAETLLFPTYQASSTDIFQKL